jgi:hypothetical protein
MMMALCHRSDFCVGYFNLRGWRQLHDHIEEWLGGGQLLPAAYWHAANATGSTPAIDEYSPQ